MSFESRTPTRPSVNHATSTQSLWLPLWLLLNQFAPARSTIVTIELPRNPANQLPGLFFI